jgi:hypothetical protein
MSAIRLTILGIIDQVNGAGNHAETGNSKSHSDKQGDVMNVNTLAGITPSKKQSSRHNTILNPLRWA